MARPATVIILPVVRRYPDGVDLGRQLMAPSADRRKVVELWRVKALREFAARWAKGDSVRR